jgi:hypothetical protein
MTDFISTTQSDGRAPEAGLPRGLVVVGLALGAWGIAAVLAGLVLHALRLL